MSDSGISAGHGEGASGTGAAHHSGHADGSGYLTGEPQVETQAEHEPRYVTTEDDARAVIADVIDRHEGLSRLYARMDEMSRQQADLMSGLQQFTGSGDGDLDDAYDDAYGDGPDVLDELDGVLTDAVNRRMDAAEEAEQAELLVASRDIDFDDLRDRYAVLQDDRTAMPIVHRAAQLCHSWGVPELIETPEFVQVVEQVALAFQVQPGVLGNRAPAPAPDGDPGLYAGRVHLESGAGAGGPQFQPKEVDWGDRIVKAAERLRPRI